ncbi:MAG: hypothetical protein AAGB19_20855 [Cyanobacteria bacterium P01_F01_bin.3]
MASAMDKLSIHALLGLGTSVVGCCLSALELGRLENRALDFKASRLQSQTARAGSLDWVAYIWLIRMDLDKWPQMRHSRRRSAQYSNEASGDEPSNRTTFFTVRNTAF